MGVLQCWVGDFPDKLGYALRDQVRPSPECITLAGWANPICSKTYILRSSMKRPKRLLSVCLLWPLFAPTSVSALVVEIQGIRLEGTIPGASCVEIFGSFPGVKIVPSEHGKIPRICYNSNRVNSISILNTAFVAQTPVKKDIVLKFEHNFPPGINGKVMARVRLQGFFSTSSGVGVPTEDKVLLSAFFSQNNHNDAIAEPFERIVGDDMESAMFEFSAKKQYLISGPRVLKGSLKVYFTTIGNKLTLVEKNQVLIDNGATMADKLDTMEVPLEEEGTDDSTQDKPSPSPQGKGRNNPAPSPIPFPGQSGGETPPLN